MGVWPITVRRALTNFLSCKYPGEEYGYAHGTAPHLILWGHRGLKHKAEYNSCGEQCVYYYHIFLI